MGYLRSRRSPSMVALVALVMLASAPLALAGQLENGAGAGTLPNAHEFAHAPLKLLLGPDGQPIHGPTGTLSGNWSGYALAAGGYTSASFDWTVPTVTYVQYPSAPAFEDSSSWVGIGGIGFADLIQLGTEQYIDSGGNTVYRPWYELLPANETVLPAQYTVSPGDSMSASLSCTANCIPFSQNMLWHLSMTNATKGWTWDSQEQNIIITYASSLSTVEWIQEASSTNGTVDAIPNFGTTNFTNLLVNGVSPNISSASLIYVLQDKAGGFSAPCQAINGDRFITAWSFGGPVCPTVTATHDFNNDGTSDIIWTDSLGGGNVAIWGMNSMGVWNASTVGNIPMPWGIVGYGDFNGDGYADILWTDFMGDWVIFEMKGPLVVDTPMFHVNNPWYVNGIGDFNGDGMSDLLWNNDNNRYAIWEMNGAQVLEADYIDVSSAMNFIGTGDFNGDGKRDILWWTCDKRNSNGECQMSVYMSLMDGTKILSTSYMLTNFIGTPGWWPYIGDFNGDGKSDLLWSQPPYYAIWEMSGSQVSAALNFATVDIQWQPYGVGDFNGDGKSDILWGFTPESSGLTYPTAVALWELNGTTVLNSTLLISDLNGTWIPFLYYFDY